tara:strand:- start:1668 stop:1937 length:270 start_codon:yes stop_codon:yes gene_type:complete
MGKAGPKASNIFQVLKASKGAGKVELPLIKGMGNPLKYGMQKGEPAKFTKEGLEKLPNDIPGKFGDVVRKEKKEKGLLQKKGCKKKYRK